MTFISITRLRIRATRYLPAFVYHAFLANRQARRAPGNLTVDAINDANWTFWTRSAWRDEASMRAFMLADPHRHSMAKLALWCDEAAVVHWVQESSQLPDWREGHRRMLAEGRCSNVTFPSEDHKAHRIAIPRL
jgi:hypothetical protein